MKNVFLWCVGHLYKQSPAPPQSKVTSGCFPRLQFRVYGSYTCRALGPFETPNLVQKVCLCWLVTGKTVTTTSSLTVFVVGISTTLSLHKNNSNTVLNLTCTYWQSLVHITKAYMRAVRRCFLGCTSSSQNSFSDSESVSSPSDGSLNCVSWEECWENVFSIVLFLCSLFALGVFDRLFSFFWAALMTGMSDISCDSLHGEKNEGNIYSLLFFVGFSFLFGARGAYSSGWEPNFNARFFLKDKQLKQVMPLLSMTARSSAVKHWLWIPRQQESHLTKLEMS